MITLKAEPYCQDCPDFTPSVKKEETDITCYSSMDFDKTKRICNTVVSCQYERRCSSMFNYLRKKDKEELQSDGYIFLKKEEIK